MRREYWKIVVAAAFLAVAGFCYGVDRWQQGTLPGMQTGAGAQTVVLEDLGPEEKWSESPGIGAEGPADLEVDAADHAADAEELCYVHVCGEVVNPGVYVLSAGSRIFEAIEAAGGFTDEASGSALNLAEKVCDGMQIVVWSEADAETLHDGSGSAEEGPHLVNLNTATKDELMTLKGIGESKAEDIIRYREESGGFSAIEDIMKVPGIKNAGFQKIKDSITV